MSQPEVGKRAPAFTLINADGKKVKLTDFKGKKNVVVYFYPKDNTPGCTVQAKAFRDDIAKYKKSKTVVLGISPDGESSHQRFIEKFDLPFELLCDTEKKACEKYGVWVQKSMFDKKYMGVQRATFLVDKNGKVAAVWPKVKVKGHSKEVLEALAEI